MTIKLMGAILVFTGCGGFGFAMASAHRREEQALGQLMLALEFMECDLSCRLTPLPQLCYSAANTASGQVHTFSSVWDRSWNGSQVPRYRAASAP